MPSASEDFEALEASGLFERWQARGALIGHAPVEPGELGPDAQGASRVLEHPRLPFVSHPYEWPFGALKSAALLHLDLLFEALDAGFTMVDASAYNLQFVGAEPVFIDTLSFRRYQPGSYWLGHRQFCEQFLNPLLLRTQFGMNYHAWYRGAPEGIPATELERLLPWWRKAISPNLLMHVSMQARLQSARHARERAEAAVGRHDFSARSIAGIVRGLRAWIEGMQAGSARRTAFGDYAEDNTYSDEATTMKAAFVADFVAAARPRVLLDLGCNTGRFARAALDAGAGYVVGVDADTRALDRAYADARRRKLRLLALHMNLSDPSPDQGWRQAERPGLRQRCAESCDALLALAVVHHLAIAGNVPLAQVLDWMLELAPRGVVEFVPKSDPMVRRLLALREDVFADYSEDSFVAALSARASVTREASVPGGGRRLFCYERR